MSIDNIKPDIVDRPLMPLCKETAKKVESILNRAMHEDADEPRGRIRAIRLYGEAAELGGVEAFVKLAEIGLEINSLLFGNIDFELDRITIPEKDRQYIKERVYNDIEELQEDELVMMLKIANEYGVLHAAVESMVNDIEEANEACDDSEWMYPDGHDDGTTID